MVLHFFLFTKIVAVRWKISNVIDFILRKKKNSLLLFRLGFLPALPVRGRRGKYRHGNIWFDWQVGKPVNPWEGPKEKCLSPRRNISFGTDSFEFFGTFIWLFGSTFENHPLQSNSSNTLASVCSWKRLILSKWARFDDGVSRTRLQRRLRCKPSSFCSSTGEEHFRRFT